MAIIMMLMLEITIPCLNLRIFETERITIPRTPKDSDNISDRNSFAAINNIMAPEK
jgi:hypothetical protein